ncbi:MAG: SDR family oxidoreductase [Deltaproteobacteria bacterium]|nr:SDR family oxidoreductase [Deltaproteobacteria bacterium]
MNAFKDKTAIVTGGASGIGRELCRELAEAGAKVYVVDINAEGAKDTASIITNEGGKAESIAIDIRDPDAVEKMVNSVASKDSLDYMFNNAGMIMFGEFRDMNYDQWRNFVDTDIMSVVYGTFSAYKIMINQGYGHIVNTSSVFGLFPFSLGTAYTAVKHAVTGLSLALRPEAHDLGVKITVACPGTVDTEVRNTYTVLKGDRNAFNSYILKQLTPNKAACAILNGVRKNKGIIAFPWYDLIPWWLYRISPTLNFWWQRKLVNMFRRKIRNNE